MVLSSTVEIEIAQGGYCVSVAGSARLSAIDDVFSFLLWDQ